MARTRSKNATTTATRLAKIEAELAEQRRINALNLKFRPRRRSDPHDRKPHISLPASGSLFGKPVTK